MAQRFGVRAAQVPRGGELRRLCGPQRRTVERPRHLTVRAGDLHGIDDRVRQQRCGAWAHRTHPVANVGRLNQRARTVVHEDRGDVVGERVEALSNAALAVGSAAHHARRSVLHRGVRDRLHRFDELRLGHDDQLGDLRHRREGLDRPRDHRLSGQLDELLGPPEALPVPRRNNNRAPDHGCTALRSRCAPPTLRAGPPGPTSQRPPVRGRCCCARSITMLPYARAFGRAKIMRPAFVCSALVTATSTVSPMSRRPFSITIIVPSSR